MIKRIEKDIFPYIGQRPINSLTSMDIIEVLQRAEQRGVGELAHRLKQNCHEIFRYAVVHELAKTNPVANFETRDVLSKHTKSHFASIEAKEIPAFLQALEKNDARLYRLTRLAIRLMMITFVRTGELINATWSEIDLEERQWNIPAERMKMRRPHLVPLSRQAMALLAELKELSVSHNDFIFPSVSNPRKSMSDNTILQGLSRLGYKGKMTGHGFRAMAMSTIKEKLGYRHEVIDRQLAHAPKNKIVAAYDRAQFLDERRVMMQDWADYLDTQAVKKGNSDE
jgi:integrase